MAELSHGAYHMADNPHLYEPQRNNTFEFIVTDIDGIMRAGAQGTEKNARFKNAQEVLRMSVTDSFIPHFTQEVVEVKRGNTTIKYAGVPKFGEGSLKFNDYIGAEVKDILKAWQNLSCNISTEKVGALVRSPYKKTCYLIEYAPDFVPVRTWKIYGCWISALNESGYTSENGEKHQIECTIQYDRAEIDLSELT
jgi:hypothetical protein